MPLFISNLRLITLTVSFTVSEIRPVFFVEKSTFFLPTFPFNLEFENVFLVINH